MAYQTKRKIQSPNIFTRFWNEFLFAREFEYETPLTPDEMAEALQTLQSREHKAWFLSASQLVHRVSYERGGDKAGNFTIELESKNRGKWWESNTAMQGAEGTITADQATGLTVIRGRTRFNGQYYLAFLAMFFFNFLAQSFDRGWFFQLFWIVIIVSFWYAMYRERNKLADALDDVIMNAKSEQNIANLIENEGDMPYEADTEMQRGYISS